MSKYRIVKRLEFDPDVERVVNRYAIQKHTHFLWLFWWWTDEFFATVQTSENAVRKRYRFHYTSWKTRERAQEVLEKVSGFWTEEDVTEYQPDMFNEQAI